MFRVLVSLVSLLIVCAGLAVLYAVRSQVPPTTVASPSSPTTTSTAAIATPTASTSQVTTCRSDQLSGTFESNGAAAGSYLVSFRLAVATGSCEVPANPPVRFLDANGSFILSAISPPSSGPAQTLRALTTGKDSGFLLIQWSGHGAEPGYRCAAMGRPIASVAVDLGRTVVGTDNVLSLDIPSAQRFGFCADPLERVSATITGSRQP